MPDTAGDVVLEHLRAQIEAFHVRAAQVVGHDAEGVHKTRVASRQLRSALGTFHSLLDRDVTDPMRDELKWFAGVLGLARDAEVIRLRLAAAVDGEDRTLMLGGIGQRIDVALVARREDAHRRIDAELAGDRYAALVATLDGLAADPPLGDAADQPAEQGLRTPIRRRWRQLRDAVAAADQAGDQAGDPAGDQEADEAGAGSGDEAEHLGAHVGEPDADHLLHEVRKAAKRFRYAAESVTAVFAEAAATAALAEQIQAGLGEQQDSIHARRFLLAQSSASTAAGGNAFGYGLLYAREEAAAMDGVDDAISAWRELRRPRHRKWLRA